MNPLIVVEVTARARGVCEARCSVRCAGSAEQLHHRRLRSQGGDDSVANLLFVCHMCHAWIHSHPNLSYSRGLLVHSWDTPSEVAVLPGIRDVS